MVCELPGWSHSQHCCQGDGTGLGGDAGTVGHGVVDEGAQGPGAVQLLVIVDGIEGDRQFDELHAGLAALLRLLGVDGAGSVADGGVPAAEAAETCGGARLAQSEGGATRLA